MAALSESEMRNVRGCKIAMIFQEPRFSLNPLMKIGPQMIEGLRVHLGLSRSAAWTRGLEWLEEVGFSESSGPMNAYPHQLSGGMRQRVLDLLHRLKKEHHLSMLMISQDLGVIAQMADRVVVMHAGHTAEECAVDKIFRRASIPPPRNC